MVLGYCYHLIMNRYFRWLFTFYILVRTVSFFLINFPIAREVIAAILIGTFAYFCIKNISFAWKLLAIELLLDGAGHFFELHSLLMRTWVLGIFAAVWGWHKIRTRTKIILPQKKILVTLGIFGAFLLWAIVNGFARGNAPHFIIQDAILYLFVLIIFPALEMETNWQPLYDVAIKVFIIGSALFSTLTFALYSTGQLILQDSYYHWFRDVAAGKITDLGLHFFRIVNAEHLLFVPIILVFMYSLMKKTRDKKLWALLMCSLIVVILNFTRIYFLGLAVGAFVLLWNAPWRAWLSVSSLTLIISALIFFSAHGIASRGQSFGLELLGVRVTGITTPQTDMSGVIRMAMLPDIYRHIKARPLLGSGLGTEVTYLDPLTHTNKSRTQFDWGYFEMITELGALGTAAYIALLTLIIYNCPRRDLAAGAIALFVINITTPALFQGFGVLYFVFLATCAQIKISRS